MWRSQINRHVVDRVRYFVAGHPFLGKFPKRRPFNSIEDWPRGVWTEPSAINDRGQIVGSVLVRGEYGRAVLWQKEEIVDLGSLPGDVWNAAIGLNNHGQIVGSSSTEDFEHAVMWDRGQIIDLGKLCDDGHSVAIAINDVSQIVGWFTNRERAQHAAFW